MDVVVRYLWTPKDPAVHMGAVEIVNMGDIDAPTSFRVNFAEDTYGGKHFFSIGVESRYCHGGTPFWQRVHTLAETEASTLEEYKAWLSENVAGIYVLGTPFWENENAGPFEVLRASAV